MSDTVRTLSALLTLAADNTSGAITPQLLRDYMVSVDSLYQGAAGTVAWSRITGSPAYALLASPTFTGTPVLPTGTTATTQSAADNSTKLATTAYADGAVATEATARSTADALKAPLASPTLTGTVTIPTVSGTSDSSTKAASTAFVQGVAALALPLAGGTMTGPVGLTNQSAPSTPSSGTAKLYTNTRNARTVPFWIDPAGGAFALQESLIDGRLTATYATASGGFNGLGPGTTTTGTLTGSSVASTNRITAVRRTISTSSATAANGAYVGQSAAFLAGQTSGAPGGFDICMVFSHETDVASTRFFAGLCNANALMTTDPGSNTTAKFGIGCDVADTNYQLIYNAASATPTKVSLGVARASGTHFVLYLNSQAGVVGISWALYNGTSLAAIGTPGTVTTNIPSNTSSDFLGFMVNAHNAAVASAVAISLTKFVGMTAN